MLKNLIFLFGFSTFVTVVWISTTIYHNSVTSKITPENKRKIEPINSTFDTKTLEQLDSRQVVRANLSEKLSIIEDNNEQNSTSSGTLPQQEVIVNDSDL